MEKVQRLMTENLRPTPALDQPDQVRLRLQDWLNESVYRDRPVGISNFQIPEDTGMSNVTVLFDCRREGDAAPTAMVGRLQAQGDRLAFPEYDLPMQYAAMEVLSRIPGLRVPALVVQEPTGTVLGMPFYIMYKTEGLIPPDIPPYHMDGWIAESTPRERGQLWRAGIEMMARLHRQSIDEPPLREFVAGHRFPKGLPDQLAYWRRYMQWGLEGRSNPHCEAAVAWLKERQPDNTLLRLCWGDARMANVIFQPDKRSIAALLDWEMLCVGDPLQDIAWWIYLDELFSHGIGVPRLDGFPSREESAAYWSSLTGLGHGELHYYRVFAGLRIALILARMSLAAGDGSMVEGGFAGEYLARVMAEDQ